MGGIAPVLSFIGCTPALLQLRDLLASSTVELDDVSIGSDSVLKNVFDCLTHVVNLASTTKKFFELEGIHAWPEETSMRASDVPRLLRTVRVHEQVRCVV